MTAFCTRTDEEQIAFVSGVALASFGKPNRSPGVLMGQQMQESDTIADPIEDEVDEAFRMTGGDARAAVRGLILGQRHLQEEIAANVSAGYVRRKPRKRNI
ncbi:hypothetical protein [Fulvimarina sp. MAC8]|uniref:hypothetical protein n=1 Tax=Fulvimarina sp. MAC8 TaxID=3162874 RepID=UPI0032EAE430